MQIPDLSHEIFTRQVQNRFVELQKLFAGFLSLQQTQAENENLGLQHQKRIKTANQILRKKSWNVIIFTTFESF